MKSTKLANRYAHALYLFALENGQLEAVFEDIAMAKQVFRENRELRVIIESPIIVQEKKSAIFAAIFEGKISALTFGFLNLIIKKKREPAFCTIFREFDGFYYKHHNIKIATLTTAVPLDKALLEKIRAILEEQTKATVQIVEVVDKDIIGGFIIKIDDFLLDASLLGKINKLKLEFAHNIYQAAF